MVTGSTLSDRLKKQRRTLDEQSTALSRQVNQLDREVENTRVEEARLWAEFAAIQLGSGNALPEEITRGVNARLGTKIQRMIEERNASLAEAEKVAGAYEASKAAIVSALTDKRYAASQARKALDAARANVEAAILADPAQADAIARVAELEHALQTMSGKLDRARQEVAEKAPAYEKDELFAYLLRRDYGTDAYSSKGMIRTLDRWVAGLVRYREASAEYRRLKQIPDWIEERISDLEEKVEPLRKEAGLIRDRHEKALAGLVSAVTEADAEVARIEADLNDLKSRRESAAKLMSGIADGTDAAQKKIVAAFVSLLADEKQAALRLMAERTDTRTDDKVLGSIQQLGRDRLRMASEADRHRSDLNALNERLKGVKQVESKLRDKGWDERNHEFTLGGSEDLFLRLALGQITADAVWRQIDGSYHRDTSAYETSSISSSWPSSSGSGNSWSTPSTSSSNSKRNDDSWSSGGGFGGGDSWSSGGGFGGDSSSPSTGGGFGGD